MGERDRENEFIEIEGLKRGKEIKIRRLGMETRTEGWKIEKLHTGKGTENIKKTLDEVRKKEGEHRMEQ